MMRTLLRDRNRLVTAFSALVLIAVLLIDMILSFFFPILKEQTILCLGHFTIYCDNMSVRNSATFYSEVCKKQN